jgi:hypothetical protein
MCVGWRSVRCMAETVYCKAPTQNFRRQVCDLVREADIVRTVATSIECRGLVGFSGRNPSVRCSVAG